MALVALASCSSQPRADFAASVSSGNVPFEVRFTPDEPSEGVSFRWDFGDGRGSDEREPVHVYEDAGDFSVRLTVTRGDSSSVFESQITAEPGAAGWVSFARSRVSLQSGEAVRLEPRAFDELGNPVTDAEFSWEADEEAGTVLPDGTFAAGPAIGEYPEGVKVTFERLGVTGAGVLPVSVVYGAIREIEIEPDSIDLRVRQRVDFKVRAYDAQGHLLPEPVVQWSAGRTGDEVRAGGLFVAGVEPTGGVTDLATVTVTAGGRSLSQTVRGEIRTGILDRLEVGVEGDSLRVGDALRLTAIGFDRFGNEVELDSVTWELVSSDFGEITADGTFTPSGGAVGVDTALVEVTGMADRVESFEVVSLVITPGDAVAITLTPPEDSIPAGAGATFTAVVTDSAGNVIADAPVDWTANSGGEMLEDGVFLAGFKPGLFTGAITATVAAGGAGNLRELSVTGDITVRERSSDMLAIEMVRQGGSAIILIDLITKEVSPLVEEANGDGGNELAPGWWPDGSRLVYSSDVSGTQQVYDIVVGSGESRQLVDDPAGSSMPAVSPDGTKLAWVSLVGVNWQIYVADMPAPVDDGPVVPATQADAIRISTDEQTQNRTPIWSPDGLRVLFTSSRSAGEVVMRIAWADGSGAPHTVGGAGLTAFGWSDDGGSILAIDNLTESDTTLLVIDAQSGETTKSVPLPFRAFLVSWSPDGSELAVVDRDTGAFWVVDTDGTGLRQVFEGSLAPRRTAWRPVPIDSAAVAAAGS